MGLVNRAAIVVKPKQPYLDWTKLDDETGVAEEVFKGMHEDPHVFLLPEYEDDEAQRMILESVWPILFEEMLEGWLRDESAWPKDRTFAMFNEWFEVQMSSMVEDLYLDEDLGYVD